MFAAPFLRWSVFELLIKMKTTQWLTCWAVIIGLYLQLILTPKPVNLIFSKGILEI